MLILGVKYANRAHAETAHQMTRLIVPASDVPVEIEIHHFECSKTGNAKVGIDAPHSVRITRAAVTFAETVGAG